MKKSLILAIAVVILCGFLPAKADEGMWMLPLIKKLNIGTMHEMGLKLTAEDIYSVNKSSLKDAIVIFGRGCTAEVVSDKGLIFTNHHCGYGQIQSHSSVEHNYLEDGFWAKTLRDELPNPDLTATFLIRIEDVTEKINAVLNSDMTEAERENAIRTKQSELESDATEGNHYNASVRSFFEGNQFFLFVYEIYKDVRLVGAPPSSIGNFGDDTDNWMWPRHTGDFSIFRIYCAPDGSPAEYSTKNVPLKPKHFLPISLKGVEDGDFSMVLGYPGGTQRYMTSYGVNEVLEVTHPNRIKIRGLRQEILMEDMMAEEKVMIQYASKYSRSSNYWKFSIGQSEGLKRLKIYEKKQKLEEEFQNWVTQNDSREEKYGDALELIEEAITSRKSYVNASQYLVECLLMPVEIFALARNTSNLVSALEKDPKNMDESVKKELLQISEEHFKNYNLETDKKVTLAMLKLYYEDVSKEFHPDLFNMIENKYKGDFEKYVDRLYSKSVFATKESFEEFINSPKVEKLKSDLAFLGSKSVRSKYLEIRYLSSQYNPDKGRRLFMDGLMKMQKDKVFYSDANFTMRLTYGKVGDYQPRDAVYYDYKTTLKGVMEKEDPGNREFIVPDKLKQLYKEKNYGAYGENGKMITCFTTNNDITGGNSGSPVINANGELIGIAFDGNWEAMSGDIAFEPELQKCINVDIRYVLFIIDKYAGATRLIDELKLIN